MSMTMPNADDAPDERLPVAACARSGVNFAIVNVFITRHILARIFKRVVQASEQLSVFLCFYAGMQNIMQTQPKTVSKLQLLEAHLRERIRGQNHVLPRIVSVLQWGELGITKPERPKGSFLLLGPTGVGKTEVTLAFTSFLLSAQHVFRFDMSEYQTQERLPLLLGSSATEREMLAMVYERSRVGTLLFDEIENLQ
jgi:hypothetical protein